jgi:hypothetical protein
MYRKIILAILLSTVGLSAMAEVQHFSSGPQRIGTLELYTSQGCSSCPPAEHYLNALREQPGLWREFIPMAFHVDYWNNLGWRDRFSSAQNTRRQRRYARLRRMATIYTPGFFADGREWRQRFFGGLPKFQHQKVGQLSISVDDKRLSGRFQPEAAPADELQVNVALLGMGLTTHIERGEREGSDTRHEFVVLARQQQALKDRQFSTVLPQPMVTAPRYAIAVWISRAGDPTPIQAVGGYLK